MDLARSCAQTRSDYSEGKSDLISKLLNEAFSGKTQLPDLKPALSLKSLAYQPDLSILAFQGRLVDRKEYVFAESPGNPGYFWGNLFVMKKPPEHGDYEKWTSFFRKDFSHQPLVKHTTFGWDSVDATEGITEDF